MKTQDIIKYLAMAAAAYLVYRWLVQNGHIPDYLGIGGGMAQGQLPAGNGQGAGAGQQTGSQGSGAGQQTGSQGSGSGSGSGSQSSTGGQGSNVPANGGGVASGSVKESTWNHAKNEATANAGLLHFWQWNFHLPSNVAAPDPFTVSGWESTSLGRPPVSVQEVETTPLNFEQWWAMAAPVLGLSGISTPGLSSVRGVNHWDQQASQFNSAPGMHGVRRPNPGMGRGFGDLRGGF